MTVGHVLSTISALIERRYSRDGLHSHPRLKLVILFGKTSVIFNTRVAERLKYSLLHQCARCGLARPDLKLASSL